MPSHSTIQEVLMKDSPQYNITTSSQEETDVDCKPIELENLLEKDECDDADARRSSINISNYLRKESCSSRQSDFRKSTDQNYNVCVSHKEEISALAADANNEISEIAAPQITISTY